MARRRVAILTLGGTIACVPDADGGVRPTISGDELIAAVPQLAQLADTSVTTFRQVPSSELGIADLIALAQCVDERFAAGFDGVVVTQGTDAMEETAFALDLLVDDPRPVVVTGAMRPATAAGADGPANLLAAIAAAASPALHGTGCTVVMEDRIHAARWVRKRHTQSTAAFRSEPVGPIGWVAEGEPRVALLPLGRAHLPLREIDPVPVALVTLGPAEEDELLAAIPSLGYRALVAEALGGGHMAAATAARLGELSKQIPVVCSSRTGAGEMLRGTYGFDGSETDLLRRGVLSAGTLDGPKARTLLRLLLGAGGDKAGVAAALEALGALGETVVRLSPTATDGGGERS